jgi:ABC-2 type transport system ATP-binding protein
MLMNILRPDRGDITVLDRPSRELGPADFQRIGYVSEGQRLPGTLTLAQYFDYLRALYPAWDRVLEKELCGQFELPPSRKIKHLSHGMRMKTLLVGALSFRPKLLVLDEPLSGLDTLVRDEVVHGLLQQAADTTILISSHELAEIESFTTHVAFLQNGRLFLQEAIENPADPLPQRLGHAFGGKGAASATPRRLVLPEIKAIAAFRHFKF